MIKETYYYWVLGSVVSYPLTTNNLPSTTGNTYLKDIFFFELIQVWWWKLKNIFIWILTDPKDKFHCHSQKLHLPSLGHRLHILERKQDVDSGNLQMKARTTVPPPAGRLDRRCQAPVLIPPNPEGTFGRAANAWIGFFLTFVWRQGRNSPKWLYLNIACELSLAWILNVIPIALEWWFATRVILPPRDLQQRLETFGCQTWGVATGRRWAEGRTTVNPPKMPRKAPTAKNFLAWISIVSRLRNPPLQTAQLWK